jgi:hypothetical protein
MVQGTNEEEKIRKEKTRRRKKTRRTSSRIRYRRRAEAVPQLRRSVAGFPLWRLGFDPGSGYAGFVVEKFALEQTFFFAQ